MFLVSGGLIGFLVFLGVLVIIVGFVISIYNQLVVLRNKVKNSWSQIDVQLKRRFDMIPNLVETVKGYAAHEESIFGEFARARGLFAQAQKTGDVAQAAAADKGITGALSRLMVVQEQYPELKANENFKDLMAQLKDTEDKIAYGRQFYNDTAMKFNNKRDVFPTNIVANLFKFVPAAYFEVEDQAERQSVKVKF
jgi:LemA protein